MDIAISLVALMVAIYAAIVARDTRSGWLDMVNKFGELPSRQPQDPRLRTLDD